MRDYIHPEWQSILQDKGLADFEALWRLQLPLLDTPNTSRGGFSSVAPLVLQHAGNIRCTLIVKRQQNHNSRTWLHPFRGVPTTQRELANIRRFERRGLETVTPVFFARRRGREGSRAVLVTEFLEDYLSLEDHLKQIATAPAPDLPAKRQALRLAANWVGRMHRAGLQHNCLYTKHLFICLSPSKVPVRGIDLEKARFQPWSVRRRVRDLASLFRRTAFLTKTDRLRFLLHHHRVASIDKDLSHIWHRISRAMDRKGK